MHSHFCDHKRQAKLLPNHTETLSGSFKGKYKLLMKLSEQSEAG